DGANGLSAYEIWLNEGNTGTEQEFLEGLAGADGADGQSAYDEWLAAGNTGTEQDFLDSLVGAAGADGIDGTNGLSAYEIWLNEGNTGTEQEFLDGLTGADGQSAYDEWLAAGNTGTEQDFLDSLVGADGADGLSAYEVWINEGNTGTEQEFLEGLAGADGADGQSAYDEWLAAGNTGTEQDFLDSLVGAAGADGQSAYDEWLATGNTGTEQDFLDSLVGAAGADGADGLSAYEVWINEGNTGTEQEFLEGLAGADGADGQSAYDEWLATGNTGTEQDFLDSLVGAAGADGAVDSLVGAAGVDGADGAEGLSAYEIWLNEGNTGTEQEFLDGLVGADGADGDSAYEAWLAAGNTGTEQDFLDSLVGPAGTDGVDGLVGPQGPPGADGQGGVTTAGTGIDVTGNGTAPDPYVITNTSPNTDEQILVLDSGDLSISNGNTVPLISIDPDNAIIVGTDGALFAPQADSINIYNSNGLLTGPETIRTLGLNGKQLRFDGTDRRTWWDADGRIHQTATNTDMDAAMGFHNGGSNLWIQQWNASTSSITASGSSTELLLGTHATNDSAPITFSTSVGGGALGTEKMRITGEGEILFNNYPNTRDDSGTTAVENILYTDENGNMLSADISALAPQAVHYRLTSQNTGKEWIEEEPVFEVVGDITLANNSNVVDLSGSDIPTGAIVIGVRFISKTTGSISTNIIEYDQTNRTLILGTAGSMTTLHPAGDYHIIVEYFVPTP
uniref:hypothetical protein n=1 Tax=Algoriphagus resistens TaxID=1750590 RepID=UPI0018E01320